MIKPVLKGIAVVLIMTIGTLLVFYLNRSDPWGRIPGKRLPGEEVTESIEDWSFMQQHPIVTLEVRPSDPYSVNTSCFLHEGFPYVRSSPRFPLLQVRQLFWGSGESHWALLLLQDPSMRLKVGNKIYTVRATRVEDPTLVREIYENQVRRNTGSTLTAEEIERIWFFWIDSR